MGKLKNLSITRLSTSGQCLFIAIYYLSLFPFRSCFPFACPKSDLAITLKLFCSVSIHLLLSVVESIQLFYYKVTKVMLAEEEMTNAPCDHLVVDRVDNLLRKAALHSYQDLLHLLSAAEDDNS